ncbi:MAG: serine/threonine-protein phosphatase [Oscillospiraceae bacterium]|jgi:protein phosphatase|nr:serine/threonine-protein phosphatase [Oscillospiraceae bacterium]
MALFKRRAKAPPEPQNTGGVLSYQLANQQHIGTRERQEDSFGLVNPFDVTAIRRDGLLAVVADGMGGMEDGAAVSEAAVEMCREAFAELDRGGDIPAQLRSAVREIDRRLYARFAGRGGTTLVLVLIYEERLYWLSVGDSGLYLRRGDGLFRLNREQNTRTRLYLRELFEEEKTDRERADSDPDGARLTEFLASGELGEIDGNLLPLALRDGDVILMCSDGVSGAVDEERLCELLREAPPEACRLIEKEILLQNNPSRDNFTSVIIKCGF